MTYINMDQEGLQDDIVKLISGETIEVNTDGFENDLETFKSKNDVLTLLIHLGYLAYGEESQIFGEMHETKEPVGIVRIPNEEIRNEFHNILRKGQNSTLVKLMCTSDQLLKDTLAGREEQVVQGIARAWYRRCGLCTEETITAAGDDR